MSGWRVKRVKAAYRLYRRRARDRARSKAVRRHPFFFARHATGRARRDVPLEQQVGRLTSAGKSAAHRRHQPCSYHHLGTVLSGENNQLATPQESRASLWQGCHLFWCDIAAALAGEPRWRRRRASAWDGSAGARAALAMKMVGCRTN